MSSSMPTKSYFSSKYPIYNVYCELLNKTLVTSQSFTKQGASNLAEANTLIPGNSAQFGMLKNNNITLLGNNSSGANIIVVCKENINAPYDTLKGRWGGKKSRRKTRKTKKTKKTKKTRKSGKKSHRKH